MDCPYIDESKAVGAWVRVGDDAWYSCVAISDRKGYLVCEPCEPDKDGKRRRVEISYEQIESII